MMMGYGFDGPLGWLGLALGVIVHLAFAALVLLSVAWLFQAVFTSKHSSKTRNSLEILKCRYAKGEIGGDEYQRLKQELA